VDTKAAQRHVAGRHLKKPPAIFPRFLPTPRRDIRMGHKKLNVELLRRAQRLILKNPTSFDINQDPEWSIEGWIVTAAGIDVDSSGDTYVAARKLLGISAAQADRLFIGYRWPLRFCRQYCAEPSSRREFKRNARVTHARIEHFIERRA
jgi:hypothetical protein